MTIEAHNHKVYNFGVGTQLQVQNNSVVDQIQSTNYELRTDFIPNLELRTANYKLIRPGGYGYKL